MKISVSQSELASAISISSRAVSPSSILPILSGAKIVVEKDFAYISATDLEITIHSATPAKIEEEGKTVIPARLLADVVKSVPEGQLRITADHGEGQVLIECGKIKYNIKELPIEDYPQLPEWRGNESITLTGGSLSEAIRSIIKSAGRDEARPVLSGVFMAAGDQKLRLVATDSYRLAEKEVDIKSGKGEFEVIVPARAMEELGRLSGVEEVEVEVGENRVGFKAGEAVLISRLIEGQYPKYKQLIPESHETALTFDREQMLAAVKRVALVSPSNAIVRAEIKKGSVRINASAQDVGYAEDSVECEVEGNSMEIAFNAQYLIDGLAAISDKRAKMELTAPAKPAVIKPEKDARFTYLLMPVKLS